MNIGEVFPSKYLRGADLPAGKGALVQIETIVLESFWDAESKSNIKKPVVFFTGHSKGMILSKSLAYKIAELLNSQDTEGWRGRTIVIYTERRLVYGKEKDVLCARLPAEREAASPA